MAQDLIHINNTPKQIVRNNYKLSVSELAKAYLDGRKGVQIVNIRIDNANAEAQIRVRHLMLNYGAEVADYRPNPLNLVGGGVPMAIVARGNPLRVANSVDDSIQSAVTQVEERLSSSIIQTKNSIKSEVAQQYYAKGDTEKLIAEASSALTQTYAGFEMTFNEFKASVNNNQNLTNQQFNTISKFIRFVEGTILLGQNGNDQILKIDNDRISFSQGDNEVAYISNNALYITDGVFINSLRIQNYAWVPRANGHLSLKKVR